MRIEIRTTGYEGETIGHFIDRLSAAGIELLIDVRRLPLSRKKGFSKGSLSEELRRRNIEYVHVPELGMPDELRKRRRETENFDDILDAYEELLPRNEHWIAQIVAWSADSQGCLLCFERDEEQCHRSRLGRFIQRHYPKVTVVPLDCSI